MLAASKLAPPVSIVSYLHLLILPFLCMLKVSLVLVQLEKKDDLESHLYIDKSTRPSQVNLNYC